MISRIVLLGVMAVSGEWGRHSSDTAKICSKSFIKLVKFTFIL